MLKHAVIVGLLLYICDVCLAQGDGEFSVNYDMETFQTDSSEKTLFVMFYAPWCGHCKKLKPTWEELAQEKNVEGSKVTIGKVDCTVHNQLCSQYGVQGYPTVKLFVPGQEPIKFASQRTLDGLKAFLTVNMGGEQVATGSKAVATNGLYELTDADFDDHIKTGSHFVKFYAPWCGHCKRLAPAWDALAAKYKDSTQVTIVKVDCTSSAKVCGSNGVRGYPTLKWFKDGKEVEAYRSERTEDALDAYVVKMTSGKVEEAPAKVVEEGPPAVANNGLFELTDANFASHVKKGSHFVKFYAPWCGHCKRLAPTWDALAAKFKDNSGVSIAKIDCTTSRESCNAHGVRGYPTLIWIKDGQKVEQYSQARTEDALEEYIITKIGGADNKAGGEAGVKATATNGLYELTQDNFAAHVRLGNHFVKFYAPWCGHCKRLAPDWEALAASFKDDDKVTIGKVDCTQHGDVCKENGVRGYPTLLWFKNGQKVETYDQARTKDALTGYINKMMSGAASQKASDGKVPDVMQDLNDMNVVDLTDDDFKETVSEDFTFVMFRNQACKSCDLVVTMLEELGTKSIDKTEYLFAVVDCDTEKKTCTEEDVPDVYPVYKLYYNGDAVDTYRGERTVAAIEKYMEAKENEFVKKGVDHGGEL